MLLLDSICRPCLVQIMVRIAGTAINFVQDVFCPFNFKTFIKPFYRPHYFHRSKVLLLTYYKTRNTLKLEQSRFFWLLNIHAFQINNKCWRIVLHPWIVLHCIIRRLLQVMKQLHQNGKIYFSPCTSVYDQTNWSCRLPDRQSRQVDCVLTERTRWVRLLAEAAENYNLLFSFLD